LGSCAAALDENYVFTYSFWPHIKGAFLVVFHILHSTGSKLLLAPVDAICKDTDCDVRWNTSTSDD